MYYRLKFESLSGDLKKTWKLLRIALNNNCTDIVPKEFRTSNGQTIIDPKQIADHFNDFFVNVGSKLAQKLTPSTTPFSSY